VIDADSARATESGQLGELLDAGAAALSQAVAAWRDESRAAARGVRALVAFARLRPHGRFDRQPGERGAMSTATREARPEVLSDVSEWAVDEVALALQISGQAAAGRLTDSLVLAEQLPGTLAKLEAGELSWAHARQMIAVVGPVVDEALRARIEGRVLGLLAHKTPPQLGDCARRIVLREDADAAAGRLVAVARDRGVRLFDRRDGSASVVLDLPLPVAAAIYRALEAYAEAARTEGDERTKQQRMADVVAELVLRPGENRLAPVTIALTLVATLETMLGGAEPGLVEGHLVPAEAVRELGYTFGLMPRPAPDPTGLPQDAGAGADAAVEPERPKASPAPHGERSPERPVADGPLGDPPSAVPAADVAPAAPDDPPPGTQDAAPPATPDDPPPATPDDPPPATPDAAPPVVPAAPPPVTPVRDRPLAEWIAAATARNAAAVRTGMAGARRALTGGTWTDGDTRALLDLGALIGVRDIAGTGLAHRPHVAIVDMLRGSLVALTDTAGLRSGRALGPPAGTDGHDATADLERFVRLRDRRCRFPGCRARARVCDLDHREPWPQGRTEHGNLCCLCEHHHRLKHQAPGWLVRATDDDGLEVTTPSGDTRVSHPPRFGTDLDVPPY
jgi:hypothetical protein